MCLTTAILGSDAVDRLDVRFVVWVHTSVPGWLVDAMRILTYLGSALVLGLLALGATVALLRRSRRAAAAFVASAFVASQLLTLVAKLAVARARPELDEPFVRLTTYAFPSGHALGATATYGALALVAVGLVDASRRRGLVAGVVAVVTVVAASRVVLGAHYLLDVLAGVAGGVALLSTLVLAFEAAGRSVLGGDGRDEQAQSARRDA